MEKVINKQLILNVVIGFLLVTLVTGTVGIIINMFNVLFLYEAYSNSYDRYWAMLQDVSIASAVFALVSVCFLIYRLITIQKNSKVRSIIAISILFVGIMVQITLCIVLFVTMYQQFISINMIYLPNITDPDVSSFVSFQSNVIVIAVLLSFFLILEIINLVKVIKNSKQTENTDSLES